MSDFLTPQVCYAAAIFGAFITALSQILLKTQANTTGGKAFFSKFLNIRVIVSYGLLFLTLAINQIALRYVPLSVMPCITSTSFIWVFVMGVLIRNLPALNCSEQKAPAGFLKAGKPPPKGNTSCMHF